MPELDSDHGAEIPEAERDLPEAFVALVMRDQWVQRNFDALPKNIKQELADLWKKFDAAESDEKFPCVLELRSLLVEYFEGAGSFLQALTGMSDAAVNRQMPERANDDLGPLSPAEEVLCRELPERIEAQQDPEARLAMQMAHIRLLNKLGTNTYGVKRQYGLTVDWTKTRTRFLGYTTAQLASGSPLSQDGSVSQDGGTDALATERNASQAEITHIVGDTLGDGDNTVTGGHTALDLLGDNDDDENGASTSQRTGATAGEQEGDTVEGSGVEGGDEAEEDEKEDPLPPSVRAHYEQLVQEYRALPSSTNSHLTAKQRAKAVEMLAVLREYKQLVPEIADVTGRIKQQVVRYAESFNVSPLSAEEEEAIKRLRTMIVITADRGRIMPRGQREVLVALIRLLRKGNRDEEVAALLTELKIMPVWRTNAEKKCRGIITRDLVPEAFAKEEAKEPPPQEPSDSVPLHGVTSGSDNETSSAETVSPPVLPSQVVDMSATNAHAAPGGDTAAAEVSQVISALPNASVEARRFALLEQALLERRETLAFLKGLSPGDPRVAVLSMALQSNATVLNLLGLDGVATGQESLPVEVLPSRRVETVAQGPIDGPVAQYRTSSGALLTLSGKVRGLVAIFDGTEGDHVSE